MISKFKVNMRLFFKQLKNTSFQLDADCLLCHGEIKLTQPANYGGGAIFPPAQLTSHLICLYCQSKLPYLTQACRVCALPLTQAANSASQSTCGECLTSTPTYNRTCAAFLYEAPINDLITQLKFNHQFRQLNLLSNSLYLAIQNQYAAHELPNAMIPVPLHPKRLRQRGFNQANLIAQKLSKRLKIPVYTRLINREKLTLPQINLSAAERKRNLKNAFVLAKRFNPVTGMPAHIAVIDDVMTTGTTANELADFLLAQGAERVDIWCIARAILA
ncbi:ComF family protein [Aliikangiella sp. IMCC44653]